MELKYIRNPLDSCGSKHEETHHQEKLNGGKSQNGIRFQPTQLRLLY